MSLHTIPESHKDEPAWLVLVKAVEQLAAAADISSIIAIVRNTARDISGAAGVCFVLKDGDRCHYVDENAITPLWKGKRFPMSACISGWCMLNDQRAVIPDIYADPRIPYDAYRPTFVKSLVVVPVRATFPVGAIGFYWAETRDFHDEELALIEALGRSISAAFAAVKAREEMQHSQMRLAMALEAGGLGAFEIDLLTGKTEATAPCKAIFGCDGSADFTRKDIIAAIHPDDRDKAMTLFSTGITTDAIYRLPFADHLCFVEMWGRLRLDENGRPQYLSGIVRDITDQVAAKARHEDLLSEQLRASRLSDIGAMASALAHELNQPLAAGSNYLKAAERLFDKDQAKALDAMGKAGSQFVRTKEIIQRVRGFIGSGQNVKTSEQIEDVCREVLELAQITARHDGVQIELKIASGLPPLTIDKVQIQQVLLNLLRNAAEALGEADGHYVTLSAARKDDFIEITVADTGPGLAPEIAEHLFQPFQTTKEGGMGVGLTLCRKIVEGHGGKLRYDQGNPGAIFTFTLPVTAN
jgi:Signal transduction histidine kinase regulating C4-dicarboxylate transport system